MNTNVHKGNGKPKSVTIKGRKVAQTSIEAYHNKETQKRIPKIEDRIIAYLKTVECDTSRSIAKHLNVERNSITQPLQNLTEKKCIIKIIKTDKCPTTGYSVRFYGIAE